MGSEGILESEKKIWTRTAPADLYYFRDEINPKIMKSTVKLQELCMTFKRLLIDRATEARALQVCIFLLIALIKYNKIDYIFLIYLATL